MKRTSKAWLILSLCLIQIGAVLLIGELALNQWDFSRLGSGKLETATVEIHEDFGSIVLRADTEDVRFLPAEDGACRVVFRVSEKLTPSASVENGTLTVQVLDTRKWYDRFSFFSTEAPSITVYLPREEYASLQVESSTGDVVLPRDFRFEEIDLSLSTGDVTCAASASGAIRIKTSTGDVLVEGASAGELSVSVSTGKVELRGVDCAGEVSVTVSTGSAKLTDIACRSLTSTGSTGKLTLQNVIAAETVTVHRSTGDVRLDGCDAAELSITTDTGDVTGTLLSEKVFLTKSDTGEIDVPRTVAGGKCEITTDTGDIEISIAGA